MEFDGEVYELQAIKNAAYDFVPRAMVRINTKDARILVEILPEDGSSKIGQLCREFIRSVLDHQVRLETSRDYRVIREMIVAQAFAPCDNLEEMLKVMKP